MELWVGFFSFCKTKLFFLLKTQFFAEYPVMQISVVTGNIYAKEYSDGGCRRSMVTSTIFFLKFRTRDMNFALCVFLLSHEQTEEYRNAKLALFRKFSQKHFI